MNIDKLRKRLRSVNIDKAFANLVEIAVCETSKELSFIDKAIRELRKERNKYRYSYVYRATHFLRCVAYSKHGFRIRIENAQKNVSTSSSTARACLAEMYKTKSGIDAIHWLDIAITTLEKRRNIVCKYITATK